MLLLLVTYVAASYGPEICARIAPLECLNKMFNGKKAGAALPPVPQNSVEDRYIDDALQTSESADLEDVSRAMRKRINTMFPAERVAGSSKPTHQPTTYTYQHSARDACVTGKNAQHGQPIHLSVLSPQGTGHCIPSSEDENKWTTPYSQCKRAARL